MGESKTKAQDRSAVTKARMTMAKSPQMSIGSRFWKRIKKSDQCWEWIGLKIKIGYGSLWWSDKMWLAHRISWTLHFGEIPNGKFVLHKCDNRACVRPSHLFLGTQLDNVRDCISKGRFVQNKPPQGWKPHKKTHCKRGHEFTEENTRINKKGRRGCRACHRIHDKKRSKARWQQEKARRSKNITDLSVRL